VNFYNWRYVKKYRHYLYTAGLTPTDIEKVLNDCLFEELKKLNKS